MQSIRFSALKIIEML